MLFQAKRVLDNWKMIPKLDFKVERRLDLRRISMPPERILSCEDGLMCNHNYEDMRGANWGQVRRIIYWERAAIRIVSEEAKTKEQFYEIAGDVGLESPIGAELGTGSLILAISALGGAPAASCRGHYKSWRDTPFVAFWSAKGLARKVLTLANQCPPIGIKNCELDDWPHGAAVYSACITDLVDFAEVLYRLHQKNNGAPRLKSRGL
jgi:hypothetical protein